MQMLLVWKPVWLSSLSLVLITLVGCTVGGSSAGRASMTKQLSAEPSICQNYRVAWVSLFKANVQAMSSETVISDSYQVALDHVRQQMLNSGIDPESCSKPYCMIQPLQGGKLDSYCGYRLATRGGGDDLYQWVPWSGQ